MQGVDLEDGLPPEPAPVQIEPRQGSRSPGRSDVQQEHEREDADAADGSGDEHECQGHRGAPDVTSVGGACRKRAGIWKVANRRSQ
ncbi:MAG: hypothetical protein BWY91_02278 [bacterium ADurb.BinA028]|nr:MAG: hypothetical protein BWY91_02278 [bacterium ADurb.BinA028]